MNKYKKVSDGMVFSKDYIDKLKKEITYEEALMGLTEATLELDKEQEIKKKALEYIKRCQNSGLLFSNIVYNELTNILEGGEEPWLK